MPWELLIKLVEFHLNNHCDMTVGLTSYLTDYTTDVGKIWINGFTNDIVKCLGREEYDTNLNKNIIPLTSAGIYIVNSQKFKNMYKTFLEDNQNIKETQVEMRDQLLPWLIGEKIFKVKGFDLRGEILDIGNYERIVYAKKHWKKYTINNQENSPL
ncbi:MAG: hypothetical protein HYW45_02475 [Candidatus Daviesbacteria bacterium]|nr:MAG: hypothetical protein HYW45_02475 [Candidatus Daviesbacteria bacterium]